MHNLAREAWMTCRCLLQNRPPLRAPSSYFYVRSSTALKLVLDPHKTLVSDQLLACRAGAVGRLLHSRAPHASLGSTLWLREAATASATPKKLRASHNLPQKRARKKPVAAAMAPEKRPASEAGAGSATSAQHRQQQQPRKKQRKSSSPDALLTAEVRQAAKHNDPLAGLAAYDKAKAEGLELNISAMETLLYLCSGGRSWDTQIANSSAPISSAAAGEALPVAKASHSAEQPISEGSLEGISEAAQACDHQQPSANGSGPVGNSRSKQSTQKIDHSTSLSPEAWADIAQRGRAIWQELEERGSANTEVAYTALGRLEAMAGRPEGALEAAKRSLAAGHQAKLRSFIPALKSFCAEGDFVQAFEVQSLISEHDLDLTEDEYALLISVCAHGAPWAQARAVLGSMSRELTGLQEGTLAAVQRYFRSPAAKEALGVGQSEWVVEQCTVSEDGRPSCCTGQLQAMDLSEEEYEAFGRGVAALAAQRERKPRDFEAFVSFLQRNGPHGAVVDGANAALFGQNWEEGGFSFAQIQAVVSQLHCKRPALKPLVVLHQSRLKAGPANEPSAAAFLDKLRRQKQLYSAPFGSNDDWYWLYAAVQAGPTALLASCDEMRDHVFQLLRPKYFRKWKQRHQVYYKFKGNGTAQLIYPAPFTVCTQHLSDSGAWLFPAAHSDQWLCAKPR